MKFATRFVAAIAAVAAVGYASVASAATYSVLPTSSITVTGDIGGFFPVTAQSPGSNVVTFDPASTIDASAGANINFTGANLDANLQPLPQSPAVGGGVGTAPADAGLAIGVIGGTIALRDFVISVSGTTPLTAGTFDLTALTLTITSGSIDYNVPAFSLTGSESLVGITANPTAGVGTLVAGVLTIPVDVSLVFEVSTGVNATVNLDGAIVAVVPEPGTIAMLGMGVVGLVAVGRRRFRKA